MENAAATWWPAIPIRIIRIVCKNIYFLFVISSNKKKVVCQANVTTTSFTSFALMMAAEVFDTNNVDKNKLSSENCEYFVGF